MTPEQIAKARQEKEWYLVSLLAWVMCATLRILSIMGGIMDTPIAFIVLLCEWGAVAFTMVMTWRMCRAIKINIRKTSVVTALSPWALPLLVEAIVLLWLYSKRTRIG